MWQKAKIISCPEVPITVGKFVWVQGEPDPIVSTPIINVSGDTDLQDILNTNCYWSNVLDPDGNAIVIDARAVELIGIDKDCFSEKDVPTIPWEEFING